MFVSGSDRWKPLCRDNYQIGGVVIVERSGHPVPPRKTWEKKFQCDPLRIVTPAAEKTTAFSSTDLLMAVRAAVAEAAGPYMGTEAASLYADLSVNNTAAVIESVRAARSLAGKRALVIGLQNQLHGGPPRKRQKTSGGVC